MSTAKIYTFGYGGKKLEDLTHYVLALDAVVVDVRYSPKSRNPTWRKGHLDWKLAGRYLHVPELGNRNYKGGPIQIANMDAGARKVVAVMKVFAPILLCVCGDVTHCHRKVVAEELARRTGVEVFHLGVDDLPLRPIQSQLL